MEIYQLLAKVRNEKPLIHHITNWVTIYDCANIVKVFGASPVMAHAKEEVADMTRIAQALVLNIGTLTPELVYSMKVAANTANEKNIPVVLDVCGAGATPLRNIKSYELLDNTTINIVKGNASEIAKVAGENVVTKGVDSTKVGKNLIELAHRFAKAKNCTVVITGEEDIIADSSKCFTVKNGHEIMTHVVGTGCMATSIIGTFAAIESDYATAAACGLVCYEIASEIAAEKTAGPGTFKEQLYDAVFNLNEEAVKLRSKVEGLRF